MELDAEQALPRKSLLMSKGGDHSLLGYQPSSPALKWVSEAPFVLGLLTTVSLAVCCSSTDSQPVGLNEEESKTRMDTAEPKRSQGSSKFRMLYNGCSTIPVA